MFSDFDVQTRQMLTGNLLMIGCCVFYLAWWLIAFKPEGAVVSMICYLLYYGLDKVKGYVDGMIPLLLVAVMMALVTAGVVVSRR